MGAYKLDISTNHRRKNVGKRLTNRRNVLEFYVYHKHVRRTRLQDARPRLRTMRNSYSFNVSEQLESEGTSDLERLVQTVRAEVYDNTPLIAVHGGSFGSQTQLAVKKVSSANLQAMLRISQTNLAKMGTRGQQELAALVSAANLTVAWPVKSVAYVCALGYIGPLVR